MQNKFSRKSIINWELEGINKKLQRTNQFTTNIMEKKQPTLAFPTNKQMKETGLRTNAFFPFLISSE